MMPISKDVILRYKDDETNIFFEFKPVIGETEDDLIKASEEFAKVEKDSDIEAMKDVLDNIIDKILVNWSGDNEGLPAFPPNGKPSEMFRLRDKIKLLKVICDLNGLSVKEQKN